MNQRLAAALIGTTMGLATFAGSTIAVSAAAPQAQEPPHLTQDEVSKVICKVLKELDLLDHPDLKDLVEGLKCKKTDPTETTTSTTSTTASEPGRR